MTEPPDHDFHAEDLDDDELDFSSFSGLFAEAPVPFEEAEAPPAHAPAPDKDDDDDEDALLDISLDDDDDEPTTGRPQPMFGPLADDVAPRQQPPGFFERLGPEDQPRDYRPPADEHHTGPDLSAAPDDEPAATPEPAPLTSPEPAAVPAEEPAVEREDAPPATKHKRLRLRGNTESAPDAPAPAPASDESTKPSRLDGLLRAFGLRSTTSAPADDEDTLELPQLEDEAVPQFAGADVSRPGLLARLRARASEGEDERRDEEVVGTLPDSSGQVSGFERFLAPALASPELERLRREVEREIPVLVRADRRVKALRRRRLFSLVLAWATVVLFLSVVGFSWFTETLTNLPAPTWLADLVGVEPAQAGLFGLALVLVFALVPVLSDSIFRFWHGAGERRLVDLAVGLVGLLLGLAALLALASGWVLLAAGTLGGYALLAGASKLIERVFAR